MLVTHRTNLMDIEIVSDLKICHIPCVFIPEFYADGGKPFTEGVYSDDFFFFDSLTEEKLFSFCTGALYLFAFDLIFEVNLEFIELRIKYC